MRTINSKTWIINLCFCWRQCSIYCCIVSLRWVSWSTIFMGSYVTFVTLFFWLTYTAVSIQRIKFGTNSMCESAVAFLPHLIELNSTRQKRDVWTGPCFKGGSQITQAPSAARQRRWKERKQVRMWTGRLLLLWRPGEAQKHVVVCSRPHCTLSKLQLKGKHLAST